MRAKSAQRNKKSLRDFLYRKEVIVVRAKSAPRSREPANRAQREFAEHGRLTRRDSLPLDQAAKGLSPSRRWRGSPCLRSPREGALGAFAPVFFGTPTPMFGHSKASAVLLRVGVESGLSTFWNLRCMTRSS